MLLLRNLFLVVVFSFVIVACGFSPVHKDYGRGGGGTNEQLAAIEFGSISAEEGRRVEQLFKTNLKRELNPKSIPISKKYSLDVNLIRTTQALGVKQDKEITRYNIIYVAKYTLRDINTKNKIKSGKSRIVGGYDAVASDFATYAAQKDVEQRIIGELARDLKLRLSSFLAS